CSGGRIRAMSSRRLFVALLAGCALVATGVNPFAQSAGPQPSAMPAPTPTPRDVRYPGTMRLRVDATDLEHHIFSVSESIPVRGGEQLTLLYPQWLPGSQSPTGRVDKLAGLVMHSGGSRLEWTRD